MASSSVYGAALQGIGSTISAFAAAKQASGQNKKIKNAMSDYPYVAYSGDRPPEIDREGYEYLRPTQDLTQDIIMGRAQGEGVGYDPARRQLLTDLARNELAMQEEDQLRSAKGAISSSGLSGNPRAYEAMAGRVKRDTGRNLENAMSRIAIEDLGRANEERDINTARLQDLNTFNFGQENAGAEFDLNQWKAEESAKQGRTGIGLDAAGMYRNPYSVAGSIFGSSFSDLGGSMMGGQGGGSNSQPAVQTYQSPTMSQGSNSGFQGYGLQPTNYGQLVNNYQNQASASRSGRRLGGY